MARPDLAARPESVPPVAAGGATRLDEPTALRCPWPSRAAPVALRGEVDQGGPLRDTLSQAGRQSGGEGPQASGQDLSDAGLLRYLLVAGQLPASWIPPEAVLEWRERVRLYVHW